MTLEDHDPSEPLGLHSLIVVSAVICLGNCPIVAATAISKRQRRISSSPGFHGVGQGLIDDVLIVTAIIFLAPISSFDEWLLEDPTVNRLVSSMFVLKIG